MSDTIIIIIRYCTQCNWLLRATWMAQELLHTFGTNINAIHLIPDTNGIYQIYINKTKIWDRKSEIEFPDPSIIKTKIRDLYLPNYCLKHTKNIEK